MGITNLTRRYFSSKIEYGSCWEDPQVIQKALHINKDDTVLSVTSSGCNVLNFLLYNAKKIFAVDYNPYQNYLLELKIEAIKKLNYDEFLELIGIVPSKRRKDLYTSVRDELSKETQKFWDDTIDLIKSGIAYNGKMEHRSKFFGKYLRFLKGKETINNLFASPTTEEQAKYFYDKVYDFSWRLPLILEYNPYLLRLKLSYGLVLDFLLGRNPPKEDFRFIKKLSYDLSILKKVEQVFTEMPLKNNYFASLLLFGYYLNQDCYFPYLKKQSYPFLKERVNRIQIQTGNFGEFLNNLADDLITKFNLSNVLDWVDDQQFNRNMKEIIRVGKNQARFCYFSTRIDRYIPNHLEKILSEKQLADQLLREDRVFSYSHLEVGKISK